MVHALTDFSSTRKELVCIARCAVEVLLQTAPRLLEVRELQVTAGIWGCWSSRQLLEIMRSMPSKAGMPASHCRACCKVGCWLRQLPTRV